MIIITRVPTIIALLRAYIFKTKHSLAWYREFTHICLHELQQLLRSKLKLLLWFVDIITLHTLQNAPPTAHRNSVLQHHNVLSCVYQLRADFTESNDDLKDELGQMWKKALVTYFKVLYQGTF